MVHDQKREMLFKEDHEEYLGRSDISQSYWTFQATGSPSLRMPLFIHLSTQPLVSCMQY